MRIIRDRATVLMDEAVLVAMVDGQRQVLALKGVTVVTSTFVDADAGMRPTDLSEVTISARTDGWRLFTPEEITHG